MSKPTHDLTPAAIEAELAALNARYSGGRKPSPFDPPPPSEAIQAEIDWIRTRLEREAQWRAAHEPRDVGTEPATILPFERPSDEEPT